MIYIMKSILRPYQEEAISSILKTFESENSQMCVLPTGSGKTVIFSNIIGKLKLKTLVIAHTRELLFQCKKTLEREVDSISCEVFDFKSNLDKDVTICSFQSGIRSKNLIRFKKLDFDLLIIDECHRSACKGYRKIIDELGFSEKKLIGFTATPFRTDKKDINEIFKVISYEKDISSMINEGYLCDFVGFSVKTKIKIKGNILRRGDFSCLNLEPIINTEQRNNVIVSQWIKIANNEKTIGFCISIHHAKCLEKVFIEKGISCCHISGNTPKKKRERILKEFSDGKIKVLLNCKILTEGFDEPSVSCILMCRPTCSRGLYIQMIGRGGRLFNKKTHCKVIDFTDNHNNIFKISNLVSDKIEINDGESFLNFSERVKKDVGEIIVENHKIFSAYNIGTEIDGFKLICCFSDVNTKEIHYIIDHDCGSSYTVHCKKLNKEKKCLKCDVFNHKFSGHFCDKVEKFMESIVIYLTSSSGEKIIRKINA